MGIVSVEKFRIVFDGLLLDFPTGFRYDMEENYHDMPHYTPNGSLQGTLEKAGQY